jgi:hypothetical protein
VRREMCRASLEIAERHAEVRDSTEISRNKKLNE